MRKLICVLAVLLVAILAGLPLAAHAAVTGTDAMPTSLTTLGGDSPSLICILPNCGGRPYCRGSNGCWVCCSD
jgi:hypothetical protein